MEERLYLAALHYVWISQKKLFVIFEKNKNYRSFFEGISRNTLQEYAFSEKQISVILERKHKCKLEKIRGALENRKAKIITIRDDIYPQYLREIPNPPYVFYLRWHIDNAPKISVVWSRKITTYGKNVISKIIPEISKYFVIVSGWAAGCDTESHKSCLQAQWKTLCVVGTWIDQDYPVPNKTLYDTIVASWWWVLSIFPVWEVGNPYNFPVRNEVVAWLSLGTLVIEAQKKSWTLITAGLSLDLWKDLFAVPWDISKSSSEGTNNLIKDGAAKLVINADDVLEEYNIKPAQDKKIVTKVKFACKIEKMIYEFLFLESLTIDEMVQMTGIDLLTITSKLSMMELSWIIKKWLWWKYEIS